MDNANGNNPFLTVHEQNPENVAQRSEQMIKNSTDLINFKSQIRDIEII